MTNTSPQLPEEHTLHIWVGSRERAALICSPNHLAELALGWALSQGFPVTHETPVQVSATANGSQATIDVDAPAELQWKRYVLGGFDAGMLLGHADELVASDAMIDSATFDARLEEVFEQFRAARGSGGFHHAALTSHDAVRLVIADISRHNAVDKVVGWAVQNQEPADQSIFFLSGRISTDIVLKAARYGAPIIATRSLPTQQAVQLAEEARIMLICRALDRRRVHFGYQRVK